MTLQNSQSNSSLHGGRRQSISGKSVRSIGRYLLSGTTLGKGNFARVELASHSLTHAKVAIKIIETDKIKEDYVRRNLLREAQIMRRVRHPNVIRLYETMKANNLYCLVTEVAEGGELLSHVRNDYADRRLTEAQARPFVRQLISALHHLHGEGVVHRDLKMENILLDKKKRNIKIVDFGLSNSHEPGQLLATHCGSPEYAAPELFVPGRNYGPEVDVWSLGVNMYAMLCGKLPFRAPRQGPKRRQKLLQQISTGIGDSHEAEMAHLIPACADMIRLLLQPDPQLRPKLVEIMDHPWITKHGLYALHPYRPLPPDQEARRKVIHLMTTYLDLGRVDIEECVGSNKCDWIAAVFNLLVDQPDGRNYLPQIAERLHISTDALSTATSQTPMDTAESPTAETPEREKIIPLSFSRHPALTSADPKFVRPRRTSLPPTVLSPVSHPSQGPAAALGAHHQPGGQSLRIRQHDESYRNYLSLRRHVSSSIAEATEERARRYSLSPTEEPDLDVLGKKKSKSFRKKLTLSNGEPPSKRYSWASPTGSMSHSTSMRQNLSGGDLRGGLFKAPADIASLMSMPTPGVLHRSIVDEHTTSGSSNGSGVRSPTQSFQKTVIRSPGVEESQWSSLSYRQRSFRPQTVAMQTRKESFTLHAAVSPECNRQLPTIEQVQRPFTSQGKSPARLSSKNAKSRTLSGILGRALRLKTGKSPTKS